MDYTTNLKNTKFLFLPFQQMNDDHDIRLIRSTTLIGNFFFEKDIIAMQPNTTSRC
jgi:hypothetical protein